jgi:DNA-binding NtrC family response regulator
LDILIADPDPNILSGYLDILGHRDEMSPTPVQDGFEATEMLVAGRFDVALLDLRLLHCDGLACAREVRAGGKEMPIVMTASVPPLAEAYASELGTLGVTEVLWKPVDFVSLLYALSRALEGQRRHRDLSGQLAEEAEAFQLQQFSNRMGSRVHVLRNRGQFHDAIAVAKRLRSLIGYQSGIDSLDFATATTDLGGLYLAAGHHEKASQMFSEAASIRHRAHWKKLN